jgi:hypothetical protein
LTIKLLEELETDTGIGWWDANRRKLNEVIQCFNDWQVKHKFDSFEKDVLLARINACRRYGEENSFSGWQYELLDEMTSWALKH